jgi:glycosyltransferase involved in cell wall biosynthesis
VRADPLRLRPLRWVFALAAWLLGPRTPSRRSRDGHLPVTLVIWNAYSSGGTVRTVVRQANALAERGRTVTVVSVVRHHYQARPFFDVHPDVRIEPLVDRHWLKAATGPKARLMRRLDRRPPFSTQFCFGREPQASLLTDVLLLGRVARTGGIVMGTRIGINLAIARAGRPSARRVAQEHLQLRRYVKPLRRAIHRSFPSLDAIVSLTHADADAYRRFLGDRSPIVAVVPNSIPDELPPAADLSARRVVSVGRLSVNKGVHRLVDAFALVADEFPDWELRIVGSGPRRDHVRAHVERRGLKDRVTMPGLSRDVDAELAQASVFALCSRFEAFGLVLLEAMAAGLAPVSFAVETGPVELLTHGHNGLLARPDSPRAFAEQLRQVMGDAELRERLGRQAREDAHAFTVAAVTDRWEDLFDELQGRPTSTSSRARPRAAVVDSR